MAFAAFVRTRSGMATRREAVDRQSRRFEGKVAFVTGAARGQGRNHALSLAREGADIVAVDICRQIESEPFAMSTPEDLAETVDQIESLDRRVIAAEIDVRDGVALRGHVDDAVAELGRLDLVCANAGIFTFGETVDLSETEWSDTIETDLTGVFNTCKAAVPHIRAGGEGGAIVMTSSTSGLMAVPNMGAYVAAKHGVVGLMRSLAIELGKDRIRVNTVNPGSTNTDMIQNDFIYSVFYGGETDATREEAEQPGSPFWGAHVLPVPWVEVDDITRAILFLLSEEARYITGVALPVDAGYMVGRWG
jgi:(+)-trans-carveol dehydrogenase